VWNNVKVTCGRVSSQRLKALAVPPCLFSPFTLVVYTDLVGERESS